MTVPVRIVVLGATLGVLVAGGLAAPMFLQNAVASDQVQTASASFADMFKKPFDTSGLVKYAITFDDTVSTEVKRTQIVSKISYGNREYVSIVTTPSGTYSSDALTSPNVRYPGVDVALEPQYRDGYKLTISTSARGTWTWTSYTSGSITYYNRSFTPAVGTRG